LLKRTGAILIRTTTVVGVGGGGVIDLGKAGGCHDW